MFGKLLPGSGAKDISKDINESVKTLSYLARAEKYFDLELSKNGQLTKPLLRIVDVIEPLRKIYVLSQKLEKGEQPEQIELDALRSSAEIIDVVNDILSLSPKGLVSSDKVVLTKLSTRLDELKNLTYNPPSAPVEEEKKPKGASKAYSGKLFGRTMTPANEKPKVEEEEIEIPDSFFNYEAPKATVAPELPPLPEPVRWEEPAATQPAAKPQITDPSFWTAEKLDEPLEWENSVPEPVLEQRAAVVEEVYEEPMQEPVPVHHQPVQTYAPAQPPVQTQSPVQEEAPVQQHRPAQTYNLPQKYFATSYAGMNLQEAAEIIADLASNPANKDIVLMEHSSSVKPVDLGSEIIADLLAIAPIADSFETGSEIVDKTHLAVLKNTDRIISICHDIANVKIEGFDRRKQKLFDKFLPNDIRKTLELAKVAYPEFFSKGDLKGEITSEKLLDFSDIILEFSAETGDKLFAELVSQIVVQIALYAEHNDLRLKFDLTTKKNRLNAETQKLESRSEIAALRSVTFVPKIARHAQDILSAASITQKQEDMVEKGLEILQLIYMHARDNYSAEMQSFYSPKAT